MNDDSVKGMSDSPGGNGEPVLEDLLNRLVAQGLKISRRDFLRLAGAGAVVLGVTAGGARSLAEAVSQNAAKPVQVSKSTVLIVQHPRILLEGYKADPAVIEQMINVGLQTLTATDSIGQAWGAMFKDSDRVCMKRNQLSAPSIWTHGELNEVITESLVKQVKLDRQGVVVFDPWPAGELGQASEAFTTRKNSIKSHLPKALSDYATALINLPILKTHGGVAITCCLKNHLGSVDNAGDYHNPGDWGGDLGANIADLNIHPAIKNKTRLIVVDAIRPLYERGPGDNPRYRWDYNGLILGTDPVAVDTVGLQILEAKRHSEQIENWQLGQGRRYLAYAEQLGLGNNQSGNIKVLQIDLGQDDHKPQEIPFEKVA